MIVGFEDINFGRPYIHEIIDTSNQPKHLNMAHRMPEIMKCNFSIFLHKFQNQVTFNSHVQQLFNLTVTHN